MPGIALFGLECAFTSATLRVLVDNSVPVKAVFLPGPPKHEGVISVPAGQQLPFLAPPTAPTASVSSTAGDHNIPVARVGDLRRDGTQRAIRASGADIIVVACFNRKIPASLYDAMPLGGVNLHPSLLPELRGPDPLFWLLREGSGRAAITLHRLARRFDSGPMLAQQRVAYQDGISEVGLEQILANIGAWILLRVLPDIASGDSDPRPQRDESASYAPHPTAYDLIVTPDMRARSAFNFAHGIAGRGLMPRYHAEGESYEIIEAVGYEDDTWKSPVHSLPEHIERLRFRDGIVMANTRRDD